MFEFIAVSAAIIALLVAIWRVWTVGKKAGRDEAKAKEVDAYEDHLQDVARANRARAAAERDGVPNDKYDRDQGSSV